MTEHLDVAALRRLLPFLWDAIAAQPLHLADQLDAGLREGRTLLRFEQSAEAPVVVVSIDGIDVCEVDLRNLIDPIP